MSDFQKMSRRVFLKNHAVAAAVAPLILRPGVLGAAGRPGANDRILIGVIGTGGRARQLMNQMPPDGRIVAISDCYIKRMEEAMAGKDVKWNMYQDYRKMFEKEKLDAVLVATPDHGRVLPCIRACEAGLDVFAEKPLTLTVAEGRVLVNVVRKTGRVFQVGSQQRTMEMNAYACALVRNSGIGRIQRVVGKCYTGPRTIPQLPEEPIPEGDDWDTWLGPTPYLPFNSKLQFGWMSWRNYSGGEMTNWGAHGIDQIQWALGMDGTGPVEVWPVTAGPNGKVSMRYANGVTVDFESPDIPPGGALFIGEKGRVKIDRNDFEVEPPELAKDAPDRAVRQPWEGPGWISRPHMQNWLDCIKTRKRPNADVEIGHRSVTICHILNIARELGRRLKWDPDKEQFVGDDEANACLDRPRRKGWELPQIA
ncbi:MAG: Gfo/Idh/MocA family oxidoreductase [Candidatus Sumerlaeia bacterium]|nr:Gfo/Idh/MocA family oxidoreductase [Candidatus Sumerlaeia bacterium]